MELTVASTETRRKPRKVLLFLGAGLAIAVVALAGYAAVHWPFTEEKVVSLLQTHFGQRVLIKKFRKTYLPPGFVAEDVRLIDWNRKDLPPLAVVRNVKVTASYSGLLRRHVSRADVAGLDIVIPPPGTFHMNRPPDYDRPAVLELVTVNGGSLRVLAQNVAGARQGHAPFHTGIRSIELNNVGQDEQVPFHASLVNATPPGLIHAEGKVGRWNTDQPRETPVSGSFRLENADLGFWKNVSGTLTSTGRFSGTLASIRTEGTVDVADFRVDGSKHKAPVSAILTAVVNEENGDVSLQDVKAHLGHTTFVSKGDITSVDGQDGKTLRLAITIPEGTIEDLLRMATEQTTPAMTGAVTLRANVEMPPGTGFLQRVQLTGDFGIGSSRFTNPKEQAVVNHLGKSAAGQSKDEQNQDPQTVLSNLKGHVAIRNGIATLTRVSVRFEGSDAEVSGTYNLLNKAVALNGLLTTTGKLADTSNGWKAGFLRMLTPFVRRSRITRVRFTITGTSSQPKFKLALLGKHAS